MAVSAFLMDKFEVTQEMFAKVQLPQSIALAGHPKRPVERVRWRDAKEYCNERSRAGGAQALLQREDGRLGLRYSANGYRLPTEAEWEYAARAGIDGPYDFGRPTSCGSMRGSPRTPSRRRMPWDRRSRIAGASYDIYGNVSEWCEDVYSPTYYKDSSAADPIGPPSPGKDVKRVMRGGNWKSSADMCRGPPFARASARAIPMPVSRPTTAASAACGG